MDFREQIFIDFKKQFCGIFFHMLPDGIPVYAYKDTTYFLDDNTKDLVRKSLDEKVNYLLNNIKFVPDPNVIY